MGRAVLLSILLSDPLHMASDSDEEVQGPSEWQTWKRSNGVSYDEKVRCYFIHVLIDADCIHKHTSVVTVGLGYSTAYRPT